MQRRPHARQDGSGGGSRNVTPATRKSRSLPPAVMVFLMTVGLTALALVLVLSFVMWENSDASTEGRSSHEDGMPPLEKAYRQLYSTFQAFNISTSKPASLTRQRTLTTTDNSDTATNVSAAEDALNAIVRRVVLAKGLLPRYGGEEAPLKAIAAGLDEAETALYDLIVGLPVIRDDASSSESGNKKTSSLPPVQRKGLPPPIELPKAAQMQASKTYPLPYVLPSYPEVPSEQRAAEAADTHSRSNFRLKSLKDSIFVTIASYRDSQCGLTIEDMYNRAGNPHAVFAGIVEQHDDAAGDISCMPPSFMDTACQAGTRFCPTDNIRIRRIMPAHAKGPTFGRYVGMMMYKGEQYVLMLDSHYRFVHTWDIILVNHYKQLQQTRQRRKVVFAHYPEGWFNPADNMTNQPIEHRRTTAYLCKAQWTEDGFPRLNGIVIPRPKKPYSLLQPWAAAGFVFADAALLSEVPFDPYLDFIFDGEEILYSIRMWTHGWDMFSPPENVAFHYYYRKSAKRYWGLLPSTYWSHMAVAKKRVQFLIDSWAANTTKSIVKAPPGVSRIATRKVYSLPSSESSSSSFNYHNVTEPKLNYLREVDVYGLGRERTLEQFYAFADLNRTSRRSTEKFCAGNH